MGWGSGSELMSQIIQVTKKSVKDAAVRQTMYKSFIGIFEDNDWDTQMECIGEDDAFNAAMKSAHPDWFEDEK